MGKNATISHPTSAFRSFCAIRAATAAERARFLQGSHSIDVSQGDLRILRNAVSAASTADDQLAQTVGLFLNDALLRI